ncbi:MerR family transcriptional regulator [Persicimonas caeni]|uniref:MerR family transcriptional regulator n=1 Tax=Persicimonas caeni TaxID=2292766 RepID=A0A4Y6PYJ0_PERCE|nr:MerR family transcriptional regulator [Persicimonas caeni]QDG53300.1 MerR family transcriptional regulator [Persicimonas caeni]QED34522.1 MerR family transcriptional regulator [Persicimonas caeni]
MNGNSADKPTLSIGALSQATGIPKETIRTWERRYGFPNPDRNEAGHRVYDVDTVARLRLVSEALDAGHRPSQVVDEDIETLRELLLTSRGARVDVEPPAPPPEIESSEELMREEWLEPWLEATCELDGSAVEDHFYRSWNKFGGIRFLDQRIGPFLHAVGEEWANGRLHVSHEHFVSERLRDFLTRQWRPLSDRTDGPKIVMTTLPGEFHCLGLHMAAVVVALAGCQVVFLGADTPLQDISDAANHQSSAAVIISVSRAYDQQKARGMLTALSAAMTRDVLLVVGGAGRPHAEGQEIHLNSWDELYEWARQLARRAKD